ncbi:hypothetical protein K435DRAFT_747317 [Dendrothele bispora CBS 962.96]|uniref:Cep57 centrosome microtubule-binding domain-containing protein n=1 Tax=Dendrothele bispora (strain CBS 962.96) TaxID=1314807 RepID=A0A4S8MLN5_DENBC|nr:hypothetical protein K435DRAFT_747317 [Dendrothele bispora CBS 962.96]
MKRQSTQLLDYSIEGDDVERDRIQLEHNLQNTDFSLRLSSQDDEEDHDSIEYPRHNSGPSPFSDFGSLIHRSIGEFDGDPHHGWSYRTGDDDEGINPYGGETMSTAAHHASALTISAGLGLGGRGARRDASLSGAEYDPDRPLHNIINGVDSKLSLFDVDPSRSKYSAAGGISFDPQVVDSATELDKILQSGHAVPPSLRSRSSRISSRSSTASSSDSEEASRPKITDALRRVSFSPKRPRSPRSLHSPHHRSSHLPESQSILNTPQHVSSPLARATHLSEDERNPTPKQRPQPKRANIFPSHAPSQPEVRLQPPTPSSSQSRQTQKASSSATKEAERQRTATSNSRLDEYHSIQNSTGYGPVPTKRDPRQKLANTSTYSQSQFNSRSRIHLPDVTGLTNAVESPAKVSLNHYPYIGSNEPREAEVRLLSVMSTIQTKLQYLEEENSISRRRVRELEHELELCKREVAKERTRVLQKEDLIMKNQRELERAVTDAKRNAKGKGKARDVSINIDPEASIRYQEVVKEKKALEALIASLRSHLTRLTADLSSHQQLLEELRSLRESDARTMKERGTEVTRLKNEVERLAGEIEVLRGVVEEGLKERRLARESSQLDQSHDASESIGVQQTLEETQEEYHQGQESLPATREEVAEVELGEQKEEEEEEEDDDEVVEEEEEEEEEDSTPVPFDPMSIPGSSRDDVELPDRTMRTDRATVGTARTPPTTSRFINDDELDRIRADVEERRSEKSYSQFDSQLLEPSRCSSPFIKPRRATVEAVADMDGSVRNPYFNDGSRPVSPALSARSYSSRDSDHQTSIRHQHASTSRPSVPTPAHAKRAHHAVTAAVDESMEETPFPEIRGQRLERLFKSAPEHNTETCTVCHRCKRSAEVMRHRPTSPSWLPSRLGRRDLASEDGEDEDEGFVDGPDEAEVETEKERLVREDKRRGKRREVRPSKDSYEKRKNLPQQTVLARVIRELEDDFTHYKSVYVELADQYKDMDPVSDVPKRNFLARHLREVVDILEQKGDQIASLYDLLKFQDKPETEKPSGQRTRSQPSNPAAALRAATAMKRHATYT